MLVQQNLYKQNVITVAAVDAAITVAAGISVVAAAVDVLIDC